MRLISLAVAVALVGYQWHLKDFLFFRLGLFREMQAIEEFPYTCRRLRHDTLEGCEDMWLDDEARTIYAACSSIASRTRWCPSMSRLNASGRRPQGDHISVLHIDEPDELFGLHQLRTSGYHGMNGDGALGLHGFDVEKLNDSRLRFWLINHQPLVDENGRTTGTARLGANSTVEVFEMAQGSDELVYVKTVTDPVITTPNGLAATGDGAFMISNDHSFKVGLRRQLDPLIGGGSISYCASSSCHRASSRMNHPNGMVRGKDGLYYIPSSFADRVTVMELQPTRILKEIDVIRVGMPIDNLSVDEFGDIYAASFPKILEVLKSFEDPQLFGFPSTIWRLRKLGHGYETKKVLEDKNASIIHGATVALHDARTGRLFIGGVLSPYVTVCNPV